MLKKEPVKNKVEESVKKLNKSDWRTRYFFYSQRVIPEAAIDNLAEYLLDWLQENKQVIVFREFLVEYKIDHCSFERFLKRNKSLRNAYEMALLEIGVRRENMALNRKIDAGTMKFMQHKYDGDWADAEVRASELRKDTQRERDIKIILPSVKELSGKRRDSDNS